MLIWLGPGVALESVIARRSEPLPAALLSSRLVTLKTAGAQRSSSASRRGRNFRGRPSGGRPPAGGRAGAPGGGGGGGNKMGLSPFSGRGGGGRAIRGGRDGA